MTTLRQIHANQQNFQKSTGPKTEEGKASARANSLKDGLTGAGVVLTSSQRTRVDERMQALRAELELAGVRDEATLKQIAVSLVRMDQCQAEEDEHTADLIRRAEECWDDDRRLDAETLGARLSSKPALVSRKLVVTAYGCLWLLERWKMLGRALLPGDDGKVRTWTPAQESLALDLLGIDPVLRIEGRRPWQMVELGSAFALVQREVARLEDTYVRRLDRLDEQERQAALRGIPVGAAAESGPGRAIWRLRRLDAAAFRKFLWATRQLGKNASTPQAKAETEAKAKAKAEALAAPPVEKRTQCDTGSSLPPLPIVPATVSRPAGPIKALGTFLPISAGVSPGR
jgi:hypothetical protein